MNSRPAAPRSSPSVRGPAIIATLYVLDSAARAVTATVLALHAYAIYKEFAADNADSYVSATYSTVAFVSFVATFLTPLLIHRYGRNRVYLTGIACCMIGMAALATSTIFGLGAGLVGRALSGVIGSICL